MNRLTLTDAERENVYLTQSLIDYTLHHSAVTSTDNEGEPCEHCDEAGAVNTNTVYGVVLGEHASLYMAVDCCTPCVPWVIRTMDPTADVTIECCDAFRAADSVVDDRMHSFDCECAHPDAL